MKHLMTLLSVLVFSTTTNAQIRDGLSFGIGGVYFQNNLSGSFELGAPLKPLEKKGSHYLNDTGIGIKGQFGYGKLFDEFFLGAEFSMDFFSSKNPSEEDNNWNFSLRHGMGYDFSILPRFLLNEHYLLYGKIGYVPYSRYITKAVHNINGPGEDHNFPGYNLGLGGKVNIGAIDLKIEKKNNRHAFDQPLKDRAISSQNQWGFKINPCMGEINFPVKKLGALKFSMFY